MHDYLLIESGGPAEGPGCARFIADAVALAGQGARVALLLIQNGVTGAVGETAAAETAAALAEFLRRGGELWIDAFSVRQRALAEADLLAGARMVRIGDVADRLLTPGVRAVWH